MKLGCHFFFFFKHAGWNIDFFFFFFSLESWWKERFLQLWINRRNQNRYSDPQPRQGRERSEKGERNTQGREADGERPAFCPVKDTQSNGLGFVEFSPLSLQHGLPLEGWGREIQHIHAHKHCCRSTDQQLSVSILYPTALLDIVFASIFCRISGQVKQWLDLGKRVLPRKAVMGNCGKQTVNKMFSCQHMVTQLS